MNPPPFETPGTMLLESDGTVLVHNEPDNNTTGGTNQWWKLTPDANGSYVDGTWSQIASMPADYAPLYFASAILPDGRMIVEGGEYNGENAVWSDQGAIYDPVTNSWRSVAPPNGWTNMGDAASEVLNDGTFMLQHPCNTCLTDPEPTVDDALLNAKNLTWTVIPATGKEDPNDEEGWTLEPSGQVLTVDVWAAVGGSQLFNPGSNTWTFSGAEAPNGFPVNPWPLVEIGPQAELPGGNVFVVGAGTSTDEYPDPCTTNTPAQTGAVPIQGRDDGLMGRGARDPDRRRRAVRQHRWTGGDAAGWERPVRRQRVHVQHPDSLLDLQPGGLELADPDTGRAERGERHLVSDADARSAERAGAVQRRQQRDGGVHGERRAEPGVGALDQVAERQQPQARRHLQPVRQAAGRAGSGSRLR